MKVIIELTPRVLKVLQAKAKKLKRSRKNYMELVLTAHAVTEKLDEIENKVINPSL
jgi:hypothetical protein